MGNFDPEIHHRRSIRLKGYDYSQPGFYFLTICIQHKECLFGYISHGTMVLNEAGKMVGKWYWKLESKFPDVKCHQMVVMPNHFHCIIQKCPNPMVSGSVVPGPVGADPCVCPMAGNNGLGDNLGGVDTGEGEHVGSPLRAVVQWFKTMTTNEYIRGVKHNHWPRFNGKLWQRDYYEHIIRNERSFQYISDYIVNNPLKWGDDKLYV